MPGLQNPQASTEQQSDPRIVRVILLGVGGVGRAMLRQLMEHREFHRREFKLSLALTVLADSGGILAGDQDRGLPREVLWEAIRWKRSGRSLSDFVGGEPCAELLEIIKNRCRRGSIVVDCTASEETVPALLEALRRGGKIVLANKKPLTLSQGIYEELTRNPASSRWETTVGSCLPIVSTLGRIRGSGDEVVRLEGTFSGTLGFLMTRLQEGAIFSKIVRQAYAAGFTEPDPREDLSGIDIARKSLILARGSGWNLDLQDVEVRGLVPNSLSNLSVNDFLEQISSLDDYFQVRVKSSHKHGGVLRYVAVVERGKCRVGPDEVQRETPLGRLKGNDNLIAIYTRLYDPNPLLIQGRGAGVPATAAGVLSDIVELAFTKGGNLLPRTEA